MARGTPTTATQKEQPAAQPAEKRSTNRLAIDFNNRGVDAFERGDISAALKSFSFALQLSKKHQQISSSSGVEIMGALDDGHAPCPQQASSSTRGGGDASSPNFHYRWITCPTIERGAAASSAAAAPTQRVSSEGKRGVPPPSSSQDGCTNEEDHQNGHIRKRRRVGDDLATSADKNGGGAAVIVPDDSDSGDDDDDRRESVIPEGGSPVFPRPLSKGLSRSVSLETEAAVVGGGEPSQHAKPPNSSSSPAVPALAELKAKEEGAPSSSASPETTFLIVRALKIVVPSSSSAAAVDACCPCKFSWAVWLNFSLALTVMAMQYNNGTTETTRRFFLLKSSNILRNLAHRIRSDPKPASKEWYLLLLLINNTQLCIARELAIFGASSSAALMKQMVGLLVQARQAIAHFGKHPDVLRPFLLNAKILSSMSSAPCA